MPEFFITIFVFIALFGLTVVLFGGWVVVMTVRGISGLIGGLFASSSNACPTCREKNPNWARFCRRCGQPRSGAVRLR